MSEPADDNEEEGNSQAAKAETTEAAIIRFPQSRVAPPGAKVAFNLIGNSAFAEKYGALGRQATGHWCSRCRGIWFGFLLEVTCPVCGNRHG